MLIEVDVVAVDILPAGDSITINKIVLLLIIEAPAGILRRNCYRAALP